MPEFRSADQTRLWADVATGRIGIRWAPENLETRLPPTSETKKAAKTGDLLSEKFTWDAPESAVERGIAGFLRGPFGH